MSKTIRKTAAILAHIGLLLSILFLIFFIICTVRARAADPSALDQKDLYLRQAMQQSDFSVYTVGRALSEENNPVRENFFIFLDLIVPLLCIVSGVLLQLAMVRPHRKTHKGQPSQSKYFRR
ncbi:MAG: hypothetical protein II049_00670 [Clostridia bacterium]|nr:hypothetical protein [Clostridia bacterium]